MNIFTLLLIFVVALVCIFMAGFIYTVYKYYEYFAWSRANKKHNLAR